VLGYVAGSLPDVVIHLGDLSLDGAHGPGHLAYGRQQLDRLPVPWRAVPGNHDIGDNPWAGAPRGQPAPRRPADCADHAQARHGG